MKSVTRLLPLLAIVVAAVAIAIAASSGGGSKTVTTTVVQPSSHQSSQPTSFNSSNGLTIHDIYKMDGPGVVDITTSATQTTGIFGFGQQQQTQGEGAGVVYDTKGDIVTDEHVISGAQQITVTFSDGYKTKAKLVGSDTGADLAVIRVNAPASQLHPLTLGDSSKVQVGDGVVAIGSPFGLPGSVTSGIVSAVGRTIQAPNQFTIPNAIQTDASINPGNSGGPLINTAGQVIGFNDQIETNNTNAQGEGSNSGVGFATPSNSAKRIVDEIIATGKAQNAYVGVSLDSTVSGGAAIAKSAGAGQSSVVPGGPAAKAGLQPGDLITAINGHRVTSVNQFVATIANYAPGNTVTLTVNRGGQTRQVKLTLGAQPSSVPSAQSQNPNQGGGGGGGNPFPFGP